jgi:hypothetical protein
MSRPTSALLVADESRKINATFSTLNLYLGLDYYFTLALVYSADKYTPHPQNNHIQYSASPKRPVA